MYHPLTLTKQQEQQPIHAKKDEMSKKMYNLLTLTKNNNSNNLSKQRRMKKVSLTYTDKTTTEGTSTKCQLNHKHGER